MTIPKWLLPTLAIVAAVAVGVAATLIGMRFAPTELVESQPGAITVPVLSPSDTASVEPGALSDDGSVNVSAVVGHTSVVAPGTGDPYALTADDEAYLEALSASSDPGTVFPFIPEEDSGGDEGEPASGDPCAVLGADASDCPEGLAATVLDLPLPEFTVRAGQSSESSCEGSFSDVPTQDRFDILTNAPASIDIDISQAGRETRTLHLETSATERERWQADFSANTAAGAWIFTATCATFLDLVPGQPFVLHIVATDDLGRVASFDRSFRTVSGLVRPPVEIYPVGNSLIWVTVPHPSNQRAEVTVFRSLAGAEPQCEQTDGGLFPVTAIATVDVDPAVLESHGYQPEFTRSTTQTFAVPEASTIIVCSRLYATSSSGTVPAWQSSTVFQSPDVSAPVATIDLVRLTQPLAANSLTILGSTEAGTECGSWAGPELDGLGTLSARGRPVCDFGTLIGARNADGSLVVTTRLQTDHGVAERSVLLPVSLISCPGGCATSPDQFFSIPISTAVRPTTICGSGAGCDDDPEGVAGYLRVKVSWTDGATSGASGWIRGASSEGTYRAPTPELPSLLLPTGTFVLSAGSSEETQSARLTVRTDRPTTFRAWLSGDCFTSSSVSEITSSVLSTEVPLFFEDLCRGAVYAAHIQLTDGDGVTAVWGSEATELRWWDNRFSTDGVSYPLGIEISVTHDSPEVSALQINRLDVGIGYEASTISLEAERPDNCFAPDELVVNERLTGSWPRTIRVQLVGAVVGRVEPMPASEGSNRCSTATSELPAGSFSREVVVTLTPSASRGNYLFYDPATGYTVHLRVSRPD